MRGIAIFLSLLFAVSYMIPAPVGAQSIPVIIDTDIGGDIDDMWALILALCSPELDVKLVVTNSHDTVGKAKILAKILEQIDRPDIPIGIGKASDGIAGPLGVWAADYRLNRFPGTVYEDGVKAMVDTILGASSPVTLLSLGPCSNIQQAMAMEPRIVERTKVIASSGSIEVGYEGLLTPDAEYNVRSNIMAAQSMYTAAWELTLAPLDCSGKLVIEGDHYREFRKADNFTTQSILEFYTEWVRHAKSRVAPDIRSTTLYDVVPVILAIDRSFFEIKEMRLVIDSRGFTVESPFGKQVHVALGWKSPDQGASVNQVGRMITELLLPRLTTGLLPKKKPQRDFSDEE